jgi:hypothetical protein
MSTPLMMRTVMTTPRQPSQLRKRKREKERKRKRKRKRKKESKRKRKRKGKRRKIARREEALALMRWLWGHRAGNWKTLKLSWAS